MEKWWISKTHYSTVQELDSKPMNTQVFLWVPLYFPHITEKGGHWQHGQSDEFPKTHYNTIQTKHRNLICLKIKPKIAKTQLPRCIKSTRNSKNILSKILRISTRENKTATFKQAKSTSLAQIFANQKATQKKKKNPIFISWPQQTPQRTRFLRLSLQEAS